MLYERILQQESIMLGIGNCKLQRIYQRYEFTGLEIVEVFIEVGGYTLTEVFCLTYIQQFLVLTIILVTARLVRYGLCYFGKFLLGHCSVKIMINLFLTLYGRFDNFLKSCQIFIKCVD